MLSLALILCSISANYAQVSLEFFDEALSATTCPYKYTCRTNQPFASDTCAYWSENDNTFYTRSCSKGYECTMEPMGPSNYTCTKSITPPTSQTSLIGEYCTKDDDCMSPYSTKCTSNKCVAAYKENATCLTNNNVDHLWCPAGQYCLATMTGGVTTGKCVNLLEVGGACQNDKQCVPIAGCNITSGATTGTCQPLFSIPAGGYIGICAIQAGAKYASNLLCQSSICGPSSIAGTYMCLGTVASATPTPQECTAPGAYDATNCLSTTESTTKSALVSECLCGLNNLSKAYCEPFPGDIVYSKYLMYTNKWVTSPGIQNCNTAGRFNSLCQKAQWNLNDTYAWAYYQISTISFVDIQNADNCTLSVFFPTYWTAKENYDNSINSNTDSSATFFTFSALAFMVFA